MWRCPETMASQYCMHSIAFWNPQSVCTIICSQLLLGWSLQAACAVLLIVTTKIRVKGTLAHREIQALHLPPAKANMETPGESWRPGNPNSHWPADSHYAAHPEAASACFNFLHILVLLFMHVSVCAKQEVQKLNRSIQCKALADTTVVACGEDG